MKALSSAIAASTLCRSDKIEVPGRLFLQSAVLQVGHIYDKTGMGRVIAECFSWYLSSDQVRYESYIPL